MIFYGRTNGSRYRRPALMVFATALVCSGAAGQSLGDMAREERERNKTTAAKTYSDDDSAKAPATQPAADATANPSGPSSGIQSARKGGYQPQPSTAQIRQACRAQLGSRMDAVKQGKSDTEAEVCLLLEKPMDLAYEVLVDRSVVLQNELCSRAYPLGLDSPKVAADPALGPRARELAELLKQFAQRVDVNLKELTRIMSDKGQAADSDPQYTEYKVRALRMRMDLGRLAGNCGRF